MWEKHTNSTYHTQDTDYYCGAAVAMMILAEMGVPYTSLDQVDLYNYNHSHNKMSYGWATDPYGLEATLCDKRPAGHYPFSVYDPTNEAEGTRQIIHTLLVYDVTAAALVYDCQHWIAVCGAQTDVDPSSSPSYNVEGIWINNPVWYNTPPPPPHDDGDGCGTGSAHGYANQFVTYQNWQDLYFTGCVYNDPTNQSQYISVCDPKPPEIELPNRPITKYMASGRKILSTRDAIKLAKNGLKEYKLYDSRISGEILSEYNPGEPLLVLRLDRPDSYYYIVPWEREGGIMAFAELGARFGVFKGLQMLSSPIKERFLSRESIKEILIGKRFELPEYEGTITLRPGTFCISPTLVWKPCRESWSPSLPFYRISLGNHEIYVRIDGEIFPQLTNGKGG